MRPAILIIDHGSRSAAANESLSEVVSLVERQLGAGAVVVGAHMELAAPTIAEAFAECVARGSRHVVAVPYFLAPGRHAAEDVPRLVGEAAAAHPGVEFSVAEALGPHGLLAQLVVARAAEKAGSIE